MSGTLEAALVPPPPPWGASARRWLWLAPLLASMLLPFAWMIALSLAPQAGSSFRAALRGPWDLANYRALFAAAGVWR